LQVELDSRDLVGALSRLFHVWEQKPRLPKDQFLRIARAEKAGHLMLSIYGTGLEAHALVPATIGGDGVFATPLAVFMPLSKVLPDGKAKLVFKNGKGFLKVQTGAYQLNLARDALIFPESKPESWDFQPLKIVPFLSALEQVSICNIETARPYSDLVYIDEQSFAATDSYRLAVATNEAFHASGALLLTGDLVKKVLKMFASTLGDTGIAWDESSVYLRRGNLYVAGRRPAKAFPQFRAVLPKSTPATASFHTFNLSQAIRRLLVVAGSRNQPLMMLRFNGNTLTITAQGDSGEVSTEEQPYSGDVQGVMVLNGKYLVDTLSVIKADSVTLEYRGVKMPLIITDGFCIHVLQPIEKS